MAGEEEGSLAVGLVESISKGESTKTGYVQIVEIKDVPGKGKHFVTISDSIHSIKCVLGSTKGNLVTEKQIIEGSVLELLNYAPFVFMGKQTAVLNHFTIAQQECVKIGDPTEIVVPAQETPSTAPNFGQPSKAPSFGGNMQSKPMTNSNIYPISSLTPYFSTNWKIKARVLDKSDVREWNNAKGTGKLFSFSLQDESGQIRVTCFNEDVDKWFNTIVENSVYILSKGRIKQDRYKGRVNNDYAMTVSRDTQIEMVQEDDNFAQRKFNFVKITDLENCAEKQSVDVIAVVKTLGELEEFQSRAGKDLKKKTLVVFDDSGVEVECTLWNRTAEKYGPENMAPGTVVVLPGCSVSYFNNRSLSANSVLLNETRIPEYQTMLTWSQSGQTIETKTISKRTYQAAEALTWEEAELQRKGWNPETKPDYKGCFFSIKGTVNHIPHDMERPPWYRSCPLSANRLTKVEESNGRWACTRTGEVFDEYLCRYVLRFELSDGTDTKIVNAFNDVAQELLGGQTAQSVEEIQQTGDEDRFSKCFTEHTFQTYEFIIRAKKDTYNDVETVKYACIRLNKLDYQKEAADLLTKLG